MTLASGFLRLFAGLSRAHGVYQVPLGAKPGEKGKLHDTTWARTVQESLTEEKWQAHLLGTTGIGVVPIRDDDNCVFGALDVDVYPLDLIALYARVRKLQLPLIVCRTKSGGAHLYLFLSEPVSAELVRGRLMEWAVLMGHPGIEVFPKQTHLASERDLGSWINAPYMAGQRSTRYAIGFNGEAMSPEQFVDAADKTAVDAAWLFAWTPPPDELGDLFEQAPPCLQTLARNGFGDWQNNGMFNVGVYLRKRYETGWQDKITEYNQRFMDPPIQPNELANVVKSVGKKSYSYMCKQEPICGVCNKQVCLTRDFGVGGQGDDPGVVFGDLEKLETDPPVWIFDVNGARMELATEDLMDQRRFHKATVNKLNKWPSTIKASTWQGIIREKLDGAKIVGVPEDATKQGQFWEQVQKFCTSKLKGRSLDELLLGKPFTEAGRTYFCSSDLMQHLAQQRFSVTEREVFKWLRTKGVEHHFKVLKGKGVNCWSLPAFSEQTEPYDVPKVKAPERM